MGFQCTQPFSVALQITNSEDPAQTSPTDLDLKPRSVGDVCAGSLSGLLRPVCPSAKKFNGNKSCFLKTCYTCMQVCYVSTVRIAKLSDGLDS